MTAITCYTTCEIRKYNRCALLNIRPAKVTHTPHQPYTCAQCYTAPLILLLLLLILPEMNMVTYVMSFFQYVGYDSTAILRPIFCQNFTVPGLGLL